MCQLVLVLLAVVAGYAGADELCCMEKSVGLLNYTLVDVKDNTFCSSDCIYERADMPGGNRICFEAGTLTVVCYEEDDVDATGSPLYHNLKYLGNPINPFGYPTDSYRRCQQLCDGADDCTNWSWYFKRCYMHGLDEGLVPAKYWVSGRI